jgi:hypothetical protein
MVGDHIGIPGVVLLFSFLLQVECLGRLNPFFWMVGCIGVWKWLIWVVNINKAVLLEIIAGSSVCPMVKTAVLESTHGVHKTELFFAWLFSQAGEACPK